jgi:hypothetical protein
MNRKIIPMAIVITLVCLAVGGLCALGALNPSAPASPVKLIFIHHSCGENWLVDLDGGLGIALRDNNYFVSDTNYGWGPDSIGDNTDIGHWWDWFRGPSSNTYLDALYTESEQSWDFYSRLATDPGGENEIVMFKSCYPNSYLGGSPGDPPASDTNPLRGQDSGSEFMTVANAKGIYNDILTYFASRRDKLFIAITAPPQVANDTDSEHAANARAFNNWLVNDWLDGYAYNNVAVFDFYNVLTSNGGDNNTNDLGQEAGNHHRWWNSTIQHIRTVNNHMASYASSEDNSHPTAAGNQKATAEFIDLLNIYYHGWQGTGISAPTVISGSATSVTLDSATLNSTVNPNGLDTSCYFEYGTTISYGSATATQMLGSGTSNISVSEDITGLDANTTHHYRLVATNSAGTTYGTDESFLTSMTQLPTHLLYFPHVDTKSPWETEIVLINTSSTQTLTGTLSAYGNDGQLIDTMDITLAPHARRQITISDEVTDHTSIGYLTFEGNSDTACGYTKFFQGGTFRVAVPAVGEVNTSDIYVSHIDSSDQWWTGISLLNTTNSTKTLAINFDNGQSKSITLNANQHSAFTINSLFGGEVQPNINSAVIKNGGGIVGLELFGSSDSSGDNYLSGILLKDETTTHIYYPHIASNSTWWTGIVAYNPSITSCNLNITPFSDDGTSLTPQTIPLAGQEKYIGTVQSLNFPDGTAWFRIVASSPITGFELFGTNDGNQLGGYTGVGIVAKAGVFAKTEKDGWTGIAFVNIENSPATVTMTAYDDSGNVIATESLNINAYEKVVNVASNLFSQDISNATYISYSSDGNFVGFQLNGSSDDMMLDGLPAWGIPEEPGQGELLQPTDLQYLGAFRLPDWVDGDPDEESWEYGGQALAYYPNGDPGGGGDGFHGSLFGTGLDTLNYVSEISIPAPSTSRDPEQLNTATTIQGFHDVRGGLFDALNEIPRVGMEYLPAQAGQTSGKLYLAWGQHFHDDASTIIPSHAWCDLDLSQPDTQGAWWIGDESLYSVNGYIFAIPQSWAAAHTGGRMLATGRFRDGGWSGMGPALFAYGPWLEGNPPAPDAHLSAYTLLRYSNTRGDDTTNFQLNGYLHSDEWEGGAWITTGDKTAVVFVGAKGSGYLWYGFFSPEGDGMPCVEQGLTMVGCFNPDGTECPPELQAECPGHVAESRGWWSSRWDAQMLFYDPEDFAAVAAGTMEPYEPQPYAIFDIDDYLFLNATVQLNQLGYGDQRRYRLGATAYDRERGFLYVLELFGDGAKPVVHVWSVQ